MSSVLGCVEVGDEEGEGTEPGGDGAPPSLVRTIVVRVTKDSGAPKVQIR